MVPYSPAGLEIDAFLDSSFPQHDTSLVKSYQKEISKPYPNTSYTPYSPADTALKTISKSFLHEDFEMAQGPIVTVPSHSLPEYSQYQSESESINRLFCQITLERQKHKTRHTEKPSISSSTETNEESSRKIRDWSSDTCWRCYFTLLGAETPILRQRRGRGGEGGMRRALIF
jgi:hypothetical protein